LFRPKIALETGVKFGFSSTFILEALTRNGSGILASIDQPNAVYRAAPCSDEAVYCVDDSLPSGFETGCLIANSLRERWRLIVGKTQTHLPAILDELGTIDLFFRDSQHTYEAMQFEFECAYPHLSPKGVLVSGNVDRNQAFEEFATRVAGTVFRFRYVGILMKA
jgi:predicted O-methyltransferase YrrM